MAYTMFGAIDVGSSEVSLTIYEISNRIGVRKVDHISYMIELGADSYNIGKIRYELVDELCDVLLEFKRKLEEYRVEYYRAYSSSALREADNGTMILNQIKIRTGLEVKILSNSEMRLLTYKAIVYQNADFSKTIQKNTAMIDIGAGSIQISLFDKQALQTTQNMRIGSMRLREMFHIVKDTSVNLEHLVEEYVSNEIDTFRNLFMNDKEFKNLIAIGDGIIGIVKCAPELHISNFIDGEQLIYICQKLNKLSQDALCSEYGVSRGTASLLLYSANTYRLFLQKAKAEFIWIPFVTVCDGIAVDFGEKHCKLKLQHDFSEDILSEARCIAKRYKCARTHIENVEGLALDIFDHIRKLHGLGKRERLFLHLAVILHGCGKLVNMNDVADNSYHIIMSTEIIGLSHMERETVANIVRYNTKKLPSYEQMENKLSVEQYLIIAKLSAILRIANALDRGHRQKINSYTITLKEKELYIVADTMEDISLETGLFRVKADYFETVYGIRPVLRQKRRV